jgi:hypothetical protein
MDHRINILGFAQVVKVEQAIFGQKSLGAGTDFVLAGLTTTSAFEATAVTRTVQSPE